MGGPICSRVAVLVLSARVMISPVAFKVLDTSFSTDHPGGALIFAQHTVLFVSLIPIALPLIFFVAALLYQSTGHG